MAELSGDAEILVKLRETGDEETIFLTPDDFSLEDGSTLDQDDQYYQEHGTFVARCEAFDFDFKVIWRATAFGYTVTLNDLFVENGNPEILVAVIRNGLSFTGSPVRDGDYCA